MSEATGDTLRAANTYRRLTVLWEAADPELQPLVTRTRERVVVLGADGNLRQ